MYFLDVGGTQVVGSSPEILGAPAGRRDHACARSPARGRAARTPRRRRAGSELLADPKERAEHLMLIDLGRNDVGRVAKPARSKWRAVRRSSATATSCTSSAKCTGSCRTACLRRRAARDVPGRHRERRAEECARWK
jgi:hypothetical protein